VSRRIAALAAVALLSACGGGAQEENKDPDFRRHLAKPLPLNKVVTDSITSEGDVDDWKIFNVDQQGFLTVTVHFDEQGGECEASLADKYGAKVAREVQSANPYVKLERRVDPGRYFIWVHAGRKCSTQYSVEARLDPD
jgi:hypothetical protein